MKNKLLALQADAAANREAMRPGHMGQLSAPLDDMWMAFTDAAAPHALLVEGEIVGSCSVDGQGQLLHFWVRPRSQQHAVALLRRVIGELGVTGMMVPTPDPCFLSTALDVAGDVSSHTLLYARECEAEGPGIEPLVVAESADQQRVVDFQVAALGAPRDFLEAYTQQRIERAELLLHAPDTDLVAVGELRRDRYQVGIAHLGVIVGVAHRRRGIASRVLVSLTGLCQEESLRPHCSTEIGNLGAQRAIERAGFRATHRMLRVTPATACGPSSD